MFYQHSQCFNTFIFVLTEPSKRQTQMSGRVLIKCCEKVEFREVKQTKLQELCLCVHIDVDQVSLSSSIPLLEGLQWFVEFAQVFHKPVKITIPASLCNQVVDIVFGLLSEIGSDVELVADLFG